MILTTYPGEGASTSKTRSSDAPLFAAHPEQEGDEERGGNVGMTRNAPVRHAAPNRASPYAPLSWRYICTGGAKIAMSEISAVESPRRPNTVNATTPSDMKLIE